MEVLTLESYSPPLVPKWVKTKTSGKPKQAYECFSTVYDGQNIKKKLNS